MTVPSPLFILAFDHRQVLRSLYPGAATSAFEESKLLMVDAVSEAVSGTAFQGGILVDEEYGALAAREAKARGIALAMPVEASRTPELVHQYGDDFSEHIESFQPDIVKTLIFHSAADDEGRKQRQISLMTTLATWCEQNGYPLMIEVLIPELTALPQPYRHDDSLFEALIASIADLQERGVAADIWKIDGLDDIEQTRRVAERCARQSKPTRCIVLGSGASLSDVELWLSNASLTDGYEGFAVGRSVWTRELEKFFSGSASREETVLDIAQNYRALIEAYVRAQVRAGA